MEKPKLIEVRFNPEHFSRMCNCTIPEAWEAIVVMPKGRLTKVCAGSKEQAITLAKAQFPGIVIGRKVK